MDNQGFKVSSGSGQSLASDTAGHAFRRLLVIVIVVSVACLAMLSAFVIYHRSNVHESKSAHDDLQSKLATSDSQKKERLDQLALEIEQINSDIKQDLDRDINQKYESISKELKDLANASNKEIAISAQSLMQSLSNVAGEGISVSGSNGTTIGNTGVLSVNQQTGELSLQGVMNQTTVNQSGKITTIGTAQDISPGSSPTFNSQTLNGNQTIAGNGEIQGNMIVQGSITGDTLAIGTSGTQNGYAICDASNNCGYSGAGSSFVQGGNSFGNPANIGTNDTQPLNVETNGVTRLSIDASGNSAFTGNVSSNGTISANSLSGNGSGVTNVNATALNGNTAGNSNGQIAINNGTVNTNLNADLLDGQHGSFYQDASNINSGVVADARLSGNVTLQGNVFNGANQLVQLTASGLLPTLDGSSLQNLNAGNVGIGTLADARLSSNVALKNATNTFTGTNNFAGLTATGILQNGYQVCDTSNNCGYATNAQFANAILQGGNSFGAQMTIGTNDNQAFAINTNGTERLKVLSDGAVLINTSTQLGKKLTVEGDMDIYAPFVVASRGYAYSIGGLGPTPGPNNNYWGIDRNSSQTYYIHSSGSHIFQSANTNSGGVVIQGGSAQTNDLLQVKNSAGTILASVQANGSYYSPSAPIKLGFNQFLQGEFSGGGNFVNLIGRGGGNDIFVGDATRDTVVQGLNYVQMGPGSNGILLYSTEVRRRGSVGQLGTSSVPWNALYLQSPSSTATPLYVKGANAQTADLQQWQNFGGTVLARLLSTGGLQVMSSGNAVAAIGSQASNGIVNVGSGKYDTSSYGLWGYADGAYGDGNLTIATRNINYNNGAYMTLGQGGSTLDKGYIRLQAGYYAPGSQYGRIVLSTGNAIGHNSLVVNENQQVGINTNSFGTGNRLTVNANATADNNAAVQLNSGLASNKGLVIQGASGQTANLQEWQNSSGTTLAAINQNGTLLANSGISNSSGNLSLISAAGGISTGNIGNFNAGGSQYLEWNISTKSLKVGAHSSTWNTIYVGHEGFSATSKGNVLVGAASGSANARLHVKGTGNDVASVGLLVQGAVSQSGDLFQAQNSAGTVLAKIDASGNLTVKSATVQGDLSVSGNATFSGSHISFSNNIRGYNVAVSVSATSQVVTFGTAHPDANYAVFCTPDWNTTCYVTNKTANGFTLNYGTAAPAGQLVDWFVAR